MLGSSPAPLVVCAYSEGQKCCWVMLRGCGVTEQRQALGLCHACCQVSKWHRPRGCLELLHHHYLTWGDRCGLQQFPFVLITNTARLLGSNTSFSHVLRQLGSRVWLSACAGGMAGFSPPFWSPCALAGEMVKEMSLKLLLVRLLEASLKPRLFFSCWWMKCRQGGGCADGVFEAYIKHFWSGKL